MPRGSPPSGRWPRRSDLNQELVTLCSACHHVIKRVNRDMQRNEDIRTRANNYLQLETPYTGETTVLHYLEVLRDRVGFDRLAKPGDTSAHRPQHRRLLRLPAPAAQQA